MYTSAKNSAATLLLFITTIIGTTAVLAAPPTPSSRAATKTGKHTTLSAEQRQIHQASTLAQNGRKAMSYIVAARQLLSEKHGTEAHQYLEQAKGLLTKLKSNVTTDNENASGLLPIYSQLGIREGVEITDQIKQQLGKTHLDAVRGKHRKVIEALKTVNIEMQYSFVDLPVVATLGKVESALKSLSAKNTRQASQALADAQEGLIRDTIVINAVKENPAS